MRSFFILITFMLLSGMSFAQQSNRTTIHFRLSDGQPLILTINEREFKKVNTKITVFDLPKKRHHVRIYRFRPFADGKGGKAELVYSGRFKVIPGNTYDAVIDVANRKLLMKDLGVSSAMSRPTTSGGYMPPPPPLAPNSKGDVAIGQDISITDAHLLRLHQDMLDTKEDSKKLERAKQFVASRGISSSELSTIASWIMFDDNKMELLKYSYTYLKDKDNFHRLESVFTMAEARSNFSQYLKTLE